MIATGRWRSFLISAVASGLVVSVAAFAQSAPWDEITILEHIDYETIAGPLAARRLENLIAAGEALFNARFTVNDGAGRPLATQAIVPTRRAREANFDFLRTAGPDANSCASCHREPVPGGAGDFTANVFVSEGFESVDFNNLDPSFSSERGTNHLFGAGLVELLAREMTTDLHTIRAQAVADARATNEPITVALITKGVEFGRLTVDPDGLVNTSEIEGVDTDLVVRPFGQKGVFGSIRQFTINAANAHHGMQAEERFGVRWTGFADFDGDGHVNELSVGDVSALVVFQATLPAPTVLDDVDQEWAAAATLGQNRFNSFGCSQCHRSSLPLSSLNFMDPSPFDTAGTLRVAEVGEPVSFDLALLEWAQTLPVDENGNVLVPLFGDLKRHQIADGDITALGNELLSQRFVEPDVFITAELWGVGTTAPYGHRNDLTTLDEVIRAHGGEARESRDAYVSADASEQSAIIAFLRTLVIEP